MRIPTISSFLISNLFQSSPLIGTYVAQKPHLYTIYATMNKFWENVGITVATIKTLGSDATNEQYVSILTELDNNIYVD